MLRDLSYFVCKSAHRIVLICVHRDLNLCAQPLICVHRDPNLRVQKPQSVCTEILTCAHRNIILRLEGQRTRKRRHTSRCSVCGRRDQIKSMCIVGRDKRCA